jgi:hypothetical protein
METIQEAAEVLGRYWPSLRLRTRITANVVEQVKQRAAARAALKLEHRKALAALAPAADGEAAHAADGAATGSSSGSESDEEDNDELDDDDEDQDNEDNDADGNAGASNEEQQPEGAGEDEQGGEDEDADANNEDNDDAGGHSDGEAVRDASRSPRASPKRAARSEERVSTGNGGQQPAAKRSRLLNGS